MPALHRLQRLLTMEPLLLRTAPDGKSLGPEHLTFLEGLQRHLTAKSATDTERKYKSADFQQHTIRSGINESRKSMGLDSIYRYDQSTNVVTLDIIGPLVHHASLFEMDCMGVASYDHINAALMEIPLIYPKAALLLNINSPGGDSRGSSGPAQFVANAAAVMPVIAYTDDLMCSAAYKLAAAANQIITSSDAWIGSIGSIIAFLDNSKYLENLGFKWEVIASGELKGVGRGPLTEAHRTYLQDIVNESASEFKSWVLQHRPGIPSEAMQGQSFTARVAPTGLIDRSDVPTLAHAQAYAASL